MTTQTAGGAMARRNDATAKLDAEVMRKAKIVAVHRDVSLAEYLSDVLRPIVDRDLDACLRQALHDQDKTSPKAKPKGPKG